MRKNWPGSDLTGLQEVTPNHFLIVKIEEHTPAQLLQKLRALSRQESVTVPLALRAAYQLLLQRYVSGEDIDGSAGLYASPADELAPFFARAGWTNHPFRRLLGNLRSFVCEAASRDAALPSEDSQPHHIGSKPLLEVHLALESNVRPRSPMPAVDLRSFLAAKTGPRDFVLTLREESECLICAVEWAADLFEDQGVRRFLGHLRTLLEEIARDPAGNASEIPILTDAERKQLLEEFNETRADYPHICLHELFEQQVEQSPDAVACIFPGSGPDHDKRVTYRELNERSNQLARYLRRQGAGSGKAIGLFVERSIEMMIGLLGIQKSGATYVPFDPGYPRERIKLALEDGKVAVLVTQSHLVPSLEDLDGRLVCLDRDSAAIAREPVTNPENLSQPEDVIYVIFTSGSTGRPKGVQVQQRSVVNLLRWMGQTLSFGRKDVFPALASVAFDMSVPELYLALINGGTVVIVSRETASNGGALAALLKRTLATIVHATPTTWGMLLDAGFDGRGLKRGIGAEPVPAELCRRLLEADPSLYNFYGPTETTVWSTYHHFTSPDEPVVVGKPVANTQVYILDKNQQPLPVGVAGEIYIGGEGVALGYLNRPELTAEKFIADPFCATPGARLYRTGDLARYLENGDIQHLGRTDFQVKLRGFRIELGEIEIALTRHPAIRQAVVSAREDKPGSKLLVAYVVLRPGQLLSVAGLRTHLKQLLPEYMIPSAFIELESMPLTPAGKIDRKHLPAPDWSHVMRQREYSPPQNLVEELVARVFAEVLNFERAGREDNFFELGGHSLNAAQLLTRLEQMFQVDIPLRTIFDSPTVAALAQSIEAMPRTGRPIESVAITVEKKRHGVPLSIAQEALWYEHQVNPNSPAYNVPLLSNLRGPLNVEVFEKALFAVVERHELLRSAILSQGGSPVLLPLKKWRGKLQQVDLRTTDSATRRSQAQRLIEEEAAKTFDVSRDPLLRCLLIRTADNEWLFLHTSPHLVFDGGSAAVLYRELAVFYEAFLSGEDPNLPALRFQFADFAAWQRRLLQADYLATLKGYWTRQLQGTPNVDMPLDFPRPASHQYRGTRKFFTLSPDLLARAAGFFRTAGTTPYRGLLAAFNIFLHCYTGLEDLCLGTPVAPTNPACHGIEDLIGHFVNTLVLRSDLSGNPSFREVIRRADATVDAAIIHSDLPLNKVVEALRLKRDPSRPLLFQINFRVTPHAFPALQLKDVTADPAEYVDTGTSKFDLALEIESTEGKACYFEYRTDLFEEKTIVQMERDFQALLSGLIRDSEMPISQVPEAKEISGRVRGRTLASVAR